MTKLQKIDFSKGIRSTEIDNNFNVMQNQINDERVNVAGSGISSGLNFSLKDFTLTITEGSLIDKKGEEINISQTVFEIEKPILISKLETKTIDSYHKIYLDNIPYSNNRIENASTDNIKDSGISATLTNMTGTDAAVKIISIDGNVLTVQSDFSMSTSVDVTYNYTLKRRDVLFINNEYQIIYRVGITSPSPSIPYVAPNEALYILGYIEIDGMHVVDTKKYVAKASIIKEFSSTRNVYTDENNKLYLCGTPFDAIKTIHIEEPKNPEVNTFWYDTSENKLKVWRTTDTYQFSGAERFTSSDPNNPKTFKTNVKYLYNKQQINVYVNNIKLDHKFFEEGSDLSKMQKETDGIYSSEFKILSELNKGDFISYTIDRYDGFAEWVPVSTSNCIPYKESYIWTPAVLETYQMDKEHDLQTFIFDGTSQRNLLYVPKSNCLTIMINQLPLHTDQFEEITMHDVIAGPYSSDLKNKLKKYYHYDTMDPEKVNEEYENIGIGFRLAQPLDKLSYVEVQVTQRVNGSPISKRFQRAASFVNENHFTYKKYIKDEEGNTIVAGQTFETSTPFRYGENQLEVFINGLKLIQDVDYIEEKESEEILKGSSINKFTIKKILNDNDKVSYRITTSIYSYDHVDGLLSGFNRRLTDTENLVNSTYDKIKQKCDYVDRKTSEVQGQIETLSRIQSGLDDRYLSKNTMIELSNLAPVLANGIAAGVFYKTYTASSVPCQIDITGVCSNNDLIILYNITKNRMLQKDSDFSIIENDSSTILKISTIFNENSTLYLFGIKFNKIAASSK